jgi:hypothetical protein
MKRKVLVAVLLSAVAASPAFCLSLGELDINAGLLFIGATDPQAAPSPLVPMFGASLPIEIAAPFYLEPGLEFYGLDYMYTGSRAVPTEIESNAGFFTIAALVSLHATLRFPIAEALEIGGSLGLDCLLRFPLELVNTSAASVEGRDPALAYFFGSGRFFYPETRIFLKWQALDFLGLIFSLRAFYPVFHLWDGEGLPFLDQLMLSGTIGFAIRLGEAPAKP